MMCVATLSVIFRFLLFWHRSDGPWKSKNTKKSHFWRLELPESPKSYDLIVLVVFRRLNDMANNFLHKQFFSNFTVFAARLFEKSHGSYWK